MKLNKQFKNAMYRYITFYNFFFNRPDKLKKFNCAGTIQDFAVAMLCNLKQPVMSVQNAASWGYFDPVKSEWNIDLLKEADFPIHLLPRVGESGTQAGILAESWHSIPAGTPIGNTVQYLSLFLYSFTVN